MSAWKSPLLFIGFVLIAAAAAALFAPLYVDWNTYRAEFEDYGRQVTGRAVTIEGPIEARLFPWPVLVLNDVRVANLEGTLATNLMEAGRIEMGMSLSPLMSGQIEVDTVAIDSPTFAFERLASGAASWTIQPDESLPALIDPDRILVSEISITNATVLAADHRREGLARIDELDGSLSAPSLSGPWRLRGTASHAGLPFEINLSTGKLVSGEAIRVGLRISPAAGAGVVYSFDGELARPEGSSLKGAVKIIPTREHEAPTAQSGMPRFEVKADVEGDFDAVTLTRIEATPAFSTDPGNFITGSARIDLGQRIAVEAGLSTARIDLGQMLGRQGRALMQSDGAFEALAQFLARTPGALDLRVDLSAASLVVGGDTLDASRLSFALDSERLRIEELTTAMPGQTRTRFSGLLVYGGGEPLMSGDVSIESVSLRDFVEWAAPDRQRAISEMWSGSRGRLMLDAKLDVSSGGVRLSEVDAKLDDAQFSGSLDSQGGSERRLAVRIDADRLDLDRYLPRGFGTLAGDGFSGSGLAAAVTELVGHAMTFGDVQFTAQAGELRFHGMEAKDIAIDVGADENVLELRTVEIGQVGAARLDVAGLLSFAGDALEGSVNAVVDAEDPRGLLRLLGAFGPDSAIEPAWAGALGPLDVKLIAEASAEDGVTDAAMALSGSAGGATAALEGRFRGERASWQDGEIELSGEMDAKSSALLAAITGLQLYERSDRPTRFAGSVAGSLSGGLATTLETEVFGTQGQFAGTIRQGRRALEAEGRVAVLAEDAAELFAIFGVPGDSAGPIAQVLAAESEVTYDGRGLRLPTLSGTAAGSAFSGDLTLVAEPARRVSGTITTDRLSLPWLLGAVLLSRDGSPHALSSHFASAVPRLEADLKITADRLDVLPHVVFQSTELDLEVTRYDVALEGRGSGPDGEPASGRLDVEIDGRGIAVDGAIAGPVALGALLQAGDGSQVLDAEGRIELAFSGSGRSPAGVLAGLQAHGGYELTSGVLKNVDPESFARDLAAAKQPSEIDGLFARSLRNGDMAFAGGSGALILTDGVLQAKPLDIRGPGVDGEARFVLEAASGDVDLSFTLKLAGKLAGLRDIPAFELAYAGSPRALETSTDAQSLRSYLSMRMLQDSVQQLEDLQRQERELIEEEKEFQLEQEERERQRRAERQREADRQLDRKQRELAARLRAQEDEGKENEGEKADFERGQPDEPAGEPEAPAARPDAAVTLSPLEMPPLEGPPLEGPVFEDAIGALIEMQAVPVPMHKPDQTVAAPVEATDRVITVPADGYLGRIPEPVFSGPTVLQPNLSAPRPEMGRR
ncbi:MAG TPA: AsmA family protein [Aestuariivirgaceae bacterium]|nr:AsmA family protein [Aestuariivirgaceae bacterium]